MKRTIYSSMAIFALLMFTTTISYGQIIAWQFLTGHSGTDGTSTGSEETINSTITHANLETSVLKRGAGINTGNLAATFHGRFRKIAGETKGTKATAKDIGSYYEFSIEANSGYKVSLSTLDITIRRNSDGPDTYRWMYSVNASGTVDEDKIFTEIGTADITHTGTTGDGDVQPQIDLSAITSLSNIEAGNIITFRLYAWGGTVNNGVFSIGKSTSLVPDALSVGGSVTPLSTTPIDLISFTARNEGNAVKLNWSTASEQGNSHFEVLRFVNDSKKVQLVGTISGNGTSMQINNYSFTDYNPLQGISYYQLKQVDYDGKSKKYEPISVNAHIKESIPFFVNVGEGENIVTIYFQQAVAGNMFINIRAVNGQTLLKEQFVSNAGDNKISFSVALDPGVYFVTMVTAEGEYVTSKFLK